ncbi:MAG: YkgJ family cysteine cluster protein [Rhodocyclaceae bacterium]|nr:YkgJ family cysteine cluster protein [Rhodocyclaceae bacterium]
MQSKASQYRDKDDIRPLPPIPADLVVGMRQLVDEVINANELTLFEKLGGVYKFLDRYNAFVSTFSVCGKGCAHCCRIGVTVSCLEAEYITVNGGPELDRDTVNTLVPGAPCPFLTTEKECSIYATRPFNCRTFHTLDDPKYCVDGNERHQTYGSAGFGYRVDLYSELARWLKEIHQRKGLPYRDIRDWFPVR